MVVGMKVSLHGTLIWNGKNGRGNENTLTCFRGGLKNGLKKIVMKMVLRLHDFTVTWKGLKQNLKKEEEEGNGYKLTWLPNSLEEGGREKQK